MDETRVRAIAERLVDVHRRGEMDRVDHAIRIPTSQYTDPERLAREVALIFEHEPQLVGFTGDIREPGDYFTADIGRRAVIVVRGDDGVARAFLNACRHRGMEVAAGSGSTPRFTCPYHNWTYSTDGRLVGVTDRGAFAGCDIADGLLELPLGERHGLLVLHPDPAGSVDVDTFLGTLGPELTHFGLEQLHPVARREARVRCNWKLTNDMGMEGYHVRYLHNRLLTGRAAWECIYDGFGRHQRLGFAAPPVLDPDFLTRTADELLDDITLTTFLYPNTFIVVGRDAVIYQRTTPGSTPDETDLVLATYSWGALDDDAALDVAHKTFELVWNITMDDDIWAQERSQRNFESGLVDEVVFGANEPALHQLHANWDAAVT